MEPNGDFAQLVAKIQKLKSTGEIDLSLDEDLSLAVMNLVSLEEHFFFTAEKTGKEEYFDLLGETRGIRTKLLKRLLGTHEGETWCIAKHLLAATMRLVEVATKLQANRKAGEAKEMFDIAYRLYALFWGIRLKLLKLGEVKQIAEGNLNVHDTEERNKPWTLEDILKKLVDCCDE